MRQLLLSVLTSIGFFFGMVMFFSAQSWLNHHFDLNQPAYLTRFDMTTDHGFWQTVIAYSTILILLALGAMWAMLNFIVVVAGLIGIVLPINEGWRHYLKGRSA